MNHPDRNAPPLPTLPSGRQALLFLACAAASSGLLHLTWAGDAHGHGRDHESDPEVNVVVPLPVFEQDSGPARKSSATYRLISNVPEGSWRWSDSGQPIEASFDVVTALVVEVSFAPDPTTAGAGPAKSPDPHTALLNRTAAELTQLFRLPTEPSGESEDEGETDWPARVAAWEAALPEVSARATALLADCAREVDVTERLGVTLVIDHHRAAVICAPVEVNQGGTWVPAGLRTKSMTQGDSSTRSFGPLRIDEAQPENAPGDVVHLLASWLRTHFVPGAAAAAILEDQDDPCAAGVPMAPGETAP